MDTILIEGGRTQQPAGRVRAVLRVEREGRYVGDVLIDRKGRVWRHADTIPPDVVLKSLVAHRRGETNGQLVGLRDGRVYVWAVVGATAVAA